MYYWALLGLPMLHYNCTNFISSQFLSMCNSRCWLLTLKSYKAWGQVIWGTISADPSRLDRVGTEQVSSFKCCHLVGPRKYAFPLAAPAQWNTLPLKIQEIPTLLVLEKAVKSWLFPQALR